MGHFGARADRGSGIAGLTTALSLHAAGIGALLVDSAELREAYRATLLQDVAALNARPSLLP